MAGSSCEQHWQPGRFAAERQRGVETADLQVKVPAGGASGIEAITENEHPTAAAASHRELRAAHLQHHGNCQVFAEGNGQVSIELVGHHQLGLKQHEAAEAIAQGAADEGDHAALL